MPVPDFQSLMLPLLQSAADGAEWSMADIRETLRASLGLGDADLAERLPSGRQTVFSNRVGWAKTFLDRALLLESPRRAHVRITERGKALLAENPDRVDMKLLMRFPEYARWREESLAGAKSARGDSDAADDDAIAETETTGTPEERLERDHKILDNALQVQLLERLTVSSPAFFEQVVVDLLVAMGYGGGRPEQGRAVGGAGDGGIDAVINEDPLGLDAVYVQAKRYARDNVIGSGALRDFSGALDDHGTTKGLFITTSRFTADARGYAERIAKRIILIDGDRLTELMVQHNVGVRSRAVYEVKRLDEDYFTGE